MHPFLESSKFSYRNIRFRIAVWDSISDYRQISKSCKLHIRQGKTRDTQKGFLVLLSMKSPVKRQEAEEKGAMGTVIVSGLITIGNNMSSSLL